MQAAEEERRQQAAPHLTRMRKPVPFALGGNTKTPSRKQTR